MNTYVIGDDWDIPVQLTKAGAMFSIGGGDTVDAAIVSSDQSKVYSGPVSCSLDASGANWPSSLVVVEIPASQSINATPGNAKVEVQVTSGGKKKTYFTAIDLVRSKIN